LVAVHKKKMSVRRLWVLSAVLLASTLRVSSQEPQRGQPPVFRGGTTLVQVDAIVADQSGRPLDDLTAADFTVLDDGRPVTVDRVRFLGAAEYGGDPALAPIRTHDDEVREASRDDVRLYAIFLDDYHVERLGELRVIEPLLAFVRQLPPTDLVGVYYPLDSVTDVNFARDRAPVLQAIRKFKGRRGDYTPTRPVEAEHLRYPQNIERIRNQITASALEGLATHLGGLKQGRKTVLFVSEGFVQPIDEMQDVLQAANRANVAIYPVDWRGLTTAIDRGPTRAQVMGGLTPAREMLRALALETGGRAIVDRNDIQGALDQVVRDASAYYLIAYESPRPDDGKFHRVTVRVTRPRATVFARPGYWAFKRDQTAEIASAAPSVPPAVQTAINHLADSLRPNADEPAEPRRRIVMPQPPAAAVAARLLAAPIIAVMHGRTVGGPAVRSEFRRTDTLAVRAATTGAPAVTARLLNHLGQPLVDLPVTLADGECQLTLPLGSLAQGDYVIELSALAGTEAAQQLVAFRVVR
jgi:VWFA-related protein